MMPHMTYLINFSCDDVQRYHITSPHMMPFYVILLWFPLNFII